MKFLKDWGMSIFIIVVGVLLFYFGETLLHKNAGAFLIVFAILGSLFQYVSFKVIENKINGVNK